MLEDLLSPLEPLCHLGKLVFAVRRTVGFLREVNVEPLSVLGVIVVCGAEHLDRDAIVIERVEFGEVEVVADAQVNKDLLVGMEGTQRTI